MILNFTLVLMPYRLYTVFRGLLYPYLGFHVEQIVLYIWKWVSLLACSCIFSKYFLNPFLCLSILSSEIDLISIAAVSVFTCSKEFHHCHWSWFLIKREQFVPWCSVRPYLPAITGCLQVITYLFQAKFECHKLRSVLFPIEIPHKMRSINS